MSLGLHNLKPANSKKKRKRVGRGNSSGHGTYSGRGQKGQRSRSGAKKSHAGKKYPSLIRKIPKMGGFRSIHPKKENINLDDLESNFDQGEVVTPQKLKEKGLIIDSKRGIKILGRGKLKKKLKVRANQFSKKALDDIKKAGGNTEIIIKKQ